MIFHQWVQTTKATLLDIVTIDGVWLRLVDRHRKRWVSLVLTSVLKFGVIWNERARWEMIRRKVCALNSGGYGRNGAVSAGKFVFHIQMLNWEFSIIWPLLKFKYYARINCDPCCRTYTCSEDGELWTLKSKLKSQLVKTTSCGCETLRIMISTISLWRHRCNDGTRFRRSIYWNRVIGDQLRIKRDRRRKLASKIFQLFRS